MNACSLRSGGVAELRRRAPGIGSLRALAQESRSDISELFTDVALLPEVGIGFALALAVPLARESNYSAKGGFDNRVEASETE